MTSTPSARPDPYARQQQRPRTYSNGRVTVEVRQGSSRFAGFFLIVFGAIWTLSSLGGVATMLFSGSLIGSLTGAGSGSVEVSGTVASLNGSPATCSPTAEFTVDGVHYTARSVATYEPCNTVVGSTVTVSYVPGDIPGTAVIPISDPLVSALPYALSGGAILSLLIGVGMLVLGFHLAAKKAAERPLPQPGSELR